MTEEALSEDGAPIAAESVAKSKVRLRDVEPPVWGREHSRNGV